MVNGGLILRLNKCLVCGKNLSSKDALIEHHKKFHTTYYNEEHWVCLECYHRNGLDVKYCELCNTQRW
jgi:ribosomal protein L40E